MPGFMWILSPLVFIGMLVSTWFGVRGIRRLDDRLRLRLSERYGVSVEYGAQGVWTVVRVGPKPPLGSRIRLYLILSCAQLGIWMGFVLALLTVIGLIAGLSAWVGTSQSLSHAG